MTSTITLECGNAFLSVEDVRWLTVHEGPGDNSQWVSVTLTAMPMNHRPWFMISRRLIADALSHWRWCQCGAEAKHLDCIRAGLDGTVDGILCCGGAACCVDMMVPRTLVLDV